MKGEAADGGIFINYRQRDSDNGLRNHAILVEALSHRLARHFGDGMVFADTSMRSGTRYPDELRARLLNCHVLLAIIHPEWLDDLHQRQDKQGPDWVLEEISTALNGSPHATNRSIRRPVVIPILLENAELPNADELPREVQKLADLKAFRFRSGSLSDDIDCVVEELESRVPASWRPSLDTEPKKSDEPRFHIVMVTLAAVGIGLQYIDDELDYTLFSFMMICISMMAVSLLVVAISWAFGRQLDRVDQQIASLPRQYPSILRLSLIGTILVPFYIYGAQAVLNNADSFQSAAGSASMFLSGLFIVFIFVLAFTAREYREDREWPPRVPSQRLPDRATLLRRAVVLLEQRLTSSWRPPLSRVQHDQAQHIVQQLRKAAGMLRNEAERSRLDWLRIEHRQVAITYAILLTGTVGLAVTVAYLLIDTTENRVRLLLHLAALTLMVSPGLCFGAMELWFRYERRQKNWLAAEVEESLERRLLPHLPPIHVSTSRPPGAVTVEDAGRHPRSWFHGSHAGPPPPDHTGVA
ncbi:MAG: TIR domain-containing protein [Actinomycetota bacterium]|nr:TIR domain-containing protein [Actinomycetota bacterium]